MPYIIYSLESPSSGFYIGLTKTSLKRRWQAHIHRAVKEARNHPLYNAIRKYGPDSFDVQELVRVDTADQAAEQEKQYIDLYRTLLGVKVYNISDGGETDGVYGSRLFWDSINSSPEKKAAYLKKLGDVKKANDWSDYEAMSKARDEWKAKNPKLAYKMAHRASRVATNAWRKRNATMTVEEKAQRSEQRKAAWENAPESVKARASLAQKQRWENAPESVKLKKSRTSRAATKAVWENRTPLEKDILASKISASHKKRYENEEVVQLVSAQLEIARKSIDRVKQGEAASRGVKAWWERLKADPVAYEDYITRRKESLRRTNACKDL